MFKKIQRVSDLKFLASLEDNIWVDNINESRTFNLEDYKTVMTELLINYQSNDLKTHFLFRLKRN